MNEWVIGRDKPLLARDLHQVNVFDYPVAKYHHLVLSALDEKFDCCITKLGGQNPIGRDRCAASLHMAKHGGSSFNPCFSFDQIGNQRADSAQPDGIR